MYNKEVCKKCIYNVFILGKSSCEIARGNLNIALGGFEKKTIPSIMSDEIIKSAMADSMCSYILEKKAIQNYARTQVGIDCLSYCKKDRDDLQKKKEEEIENMWRLKDNFKPPQNCPYYLEQIVEI